jgi:hypothetical protein
MSESECVQTVLRLDGMVVVIKPMAPGRYELVLEHPSGRVARPIPPEIARDPLNAPQFESIVRELKAALASEGNDRRTKPRAPTRGPRH